MTAAVGDKYADPALGNVTGSNSVNVFLGMGLPWVYAVIVEGGLYINTFENPGFYTEAGSLGFSVIVFTILAITCLIFIIARRFVVGGELGGSKFGRTWSCVFLCLLWIIFVVLASLQAYSEQTGFDLSDLGQFDDTKVHRLPKCWSDVQIKKMKEIKSAPNPAGGADLVYPTADGKTLYDSRLSISMCIADVIKARKTNKDTAYPTDGSCGTPL